MAGAGPAAATLTAGTGFSTNGELLGVAATSPSNAWAVGTTSLSAPRTLIVHWNGTRWRRVSGPAPAGGVLLGVAAASPASAWAVGATFHGRSLILRWDGRRWLRVPSPSPRASEGDTLFSVAARSARDAWAVGVEGGVRTPARPLILHWNGQAWHQVASPDLRGGMLTGVAATSAASAWAVGAQIQARTRPVLLHWDGRAWRAARDPASVPGAGFQAVSASSADRIWVVGANVNPSVNRSVSMQWNGATWTREPVTARGQLEGVAAGPAGPAWAVGSTFAAGGSVRWSRAGTAGPGPG